MKPETTPGDSRPNLRRRNFLLTASLGGAGVVAAGIATKAPLQPAPAPAAPATDAARGYQVSDHVLHYYRTTRT